MYTMKVLVMTEKESTSSRCYRAAPFYNHVIVTDENGKFLRVTKDRFDWGDNENKVTLCLRGLYV